MIHTRKKNKEGEPPPVPALRCGLSLLALCVGGLPIQRTYNAPSQNRPPKAPSCRKNFCAPGQKRPAAEQASFRASVAHSLQIPRAFFAPADKSESVRYRRIPVLMRIIFVLRRFYGRSPMPPSSVIVSPFIYLKSPPAIWTQTRPMSFSTSPSRPAGGMRTFCRYASG